MHNLSLKSPRQLFIGGSWTDPIDGKTHDVIAPSTEELYLTVGEAGVEDIRRAVAAARCAFDQGPWPRMSPVERGRYLTAMADEINARVPDIAVSWPNEMGILHSFATAFAAGLGDLFRMYGSMAEKFDFVRPMPTVTGLGGALLVHEPVGVVGAIIPWNAPLQLMALKVAPALLSGCTIVVKSSPEAPTQGLILAEVAEKVGLPDGVINVVTADRLASEELVRNSDVDKIAFTGSTATGKKIASILGGRMARYTMELGGKSAAIVLDDFDVEVAAQTIAATNAAMTGQFCIALSRVIVSRNRHDQLLDALSGAYSSIQVGDPFDPNAGMGPLATRVQRDRVQGYVDGAKAEGLIPTVGGARPRHLNRGFYFEPTVFGNVSNRARLAQEEVFGPVVAVVPVDDEQAMVEAANDSSYGLHGVVFTNDDEKAYSFARRVRTGTFSQNALHSDTTIGFGGFKESGVGREGGEQGLQAYLETKTVLLNHRPADLSLA